MQISTLIKHKKILFIPIYSMRDYITNLYKLDNDGNFARIKSIIGDNKADVLIPENSIYNDVSFNVIKCKEYGKNAKETRYSEFKNLETYVNLENYDFIICEPNILTLRLANSKFKSKVIYWCVASYTNIGVPWFVKEFKNVDREISKLIKIAVVNNEQRKWFGKNAYIEHAFYNAKLFDYISIFIPFRQSDKNYHVEEIYNALLKLSNQKDVKTFKVFYTDMNSSNIIQSNERFIKIDSNHDVYLQMLKSRPIIPYFENDSILQHISLYEFRYYRCKLITLRDIKYDISNIYNKFYSILKIKNKGD